MKYTKSTIGLLSILTLIAVPSCGTDGYSNSSNHSSGGYGQGTPNVTKLNNGNYLVSYDGKTAAYNSSGVRMSDSGMSSYQRSQAQRSVDSYRREQSGSDNHSGRGHGGTPEVRPRQDGKIEVMMPDGNVLLYNKSGGLIQKGSSVNGAELRKSNRAVQAYLREQR